MIYKTLRRLQGVSLFRFKSFLIVLSVKGRIVLDVSKNNKLMLSSSSFNDNIISESKNVFSSILHGLKAFYVKKLMLVFRTPLACHMPTASQYQNLNSYRPHPDPVHSIAGHLLTLLPLSSFS